MAGKRLTNSELHLQRLQEEDEARRAEEKGICELFPQDEDAPLSRDASSAQAPGSARADSGAR